MVEAESGGVAHRGCFYARDPDSGALILLTDDDSVLLLRDAAGLRLLSPPTPGDRCPEASLGGGEDGVDGDEVEGGAGGGLLAPGGGGGARGRGRAAGAAQGLPHQAPPSLQSDRSGSSFSSCFFLPSPVVPSWRSA